MSIFNPNNIFTKSVSSPEKYDYFVPVGSEEYTEDSLTKTHADNSSVCAKKITRSDGSVKFLVKIDRSSKFYNPFSIYDTDSTGNSFLASVCRSDKKFKEVNEKAFILYTKFLSTKNMALFNNSEREDF